MLTGLGTIEALTAKVQEQAAQKRDFAVPLKRMTLVAGTPGPKDQNGEPEAARSSLVIDGPGSFELTRHAETQFAQRHGIPVKYWDRMARFDPKLLETNANAWLHNAGAATNDRMMLRALGTKGRAYLSPRYRRIDHDKVLAMLLPVLLAAGVAVKSCEVTEHRLHLQVSTGRLSGEVRRGDVVEMGLAITNSEVGTGAYAIDLLLWRLACENGLVLSSVSRSTHVGKHIGGSGEEAIELYSDETKMLDDAALLSKTRDQVRGLLTQEAFSAVLTRAQSATKIVLPDILGAAQFVADEVIELTQGEKVALLSEAAQGEDGPPTAWKLVNAVTALAHNATDYDRAVELEWAGGKLLQMTGAQWEKAAAAKFDPKAN